MFRLDIKKRNNDIYESASEGMHGLRAACVLLAVLAMLSPALGDGVSFLDVNACDGTLALGGAMDNAVLYDQVFNWMHQKKISNWTYKGVPATGSLRAHFALPENETLVCAEVSYKADLELPGVFETFLYHLGLNLNLPINVDKTVCASAEALFEQAEVHVAVVNVVYINAKHDVTEGRLLRSATDVRIDIPWYAQMLSRLIKSHIGTSVGEKNRAVRDSVCTAAAKPALLARNSSFLTPPREELLAVHLRRRRRGDEAGGRAPRLWRLRQQTQDTPDCVSCTHDNSTHDNSTHDTPDNSTHDNSSIA